MPLHFGKRFHGIDDGETATLLHSLDFSKTCSNSSFEKFTSPLSLKLK